ncbi:hypothetical protein HpRN126_07500 [Helicobacter pylori]
MAKHKNYEILNLIGYALAKFDNDFIKEFGFSTKNAFFEYCVQIGLADTTGVIKNRMDLFDYFFPNKRKGWWQKGDVYIYRKLWIDSLFKDEDAKGFSHIVKLFLQEQYGIKDLGITLNAYLKTRYKSMQETGLEAELYFLNHYKNIEVFSCGSLKNMRLFGDGYDFYIQTNKQAFLVFVTLALYNPLGWVIIQSCSSLLTIAINVILGSLIFMARIFSKKSMASSNSTMPLISLKCER